MVPDAVTVTDLVKRGGVGAGEIAEGAVMENHVGRHVLRMGKLGAEGQESREVVPIDPIPVIVRQIGLRIETATVAAFCIAHVPTRAIPPKRRDVYLLPLRMLHTCANLGEAHTPRYTKTYVPPSSIGSGGIDMLRF